MSRIRGLELLFNLEKNNFKSREDCVVAAIHCLLINENLQCVGIGDVWPESNSSSTELLPKEWNSNQEVYSLRYTTKDNKSRFLLKITKMEHMLQIDVVMNEDTVANMSVPVASYISDEYTDYSNAYKDLESLSESFRKDVMQKFQPKPKKISSSEPPKSNTGESSSNPDPPPRYPAYLQQERDPYQFGFPRVGGSDLNPFSSGGGGMLMDPSGFGIPSRPTLPQFGVGGSRGFLPRGAVPPGARFDPIMPPMPDHRFGPDRDHFRPPDFDDFM